MITPWGIYMNPRRTGGLYALPLGVSAQPRESISGRASETPNPFRQARRSILFIEPPLFFDSPMRKGITGNDPIDVRPHAVPIAGDLTH